MSELNRYEMENQEVFESAPASGSEEWFSIPDEACCSPEFPQGCILGE